MRNSLAVWVLGLALLAGCGETPKGSAPSGSGPTGVPPDDGPVPAGAGASKTEGAAGGAVLPTPETIKSGAYTPLSRPLYIYVNKKSLAAKPEVALYVHHFLNEGQSAVSEVGYVPLADEDIKASRAALSEAGVTTAPAGEVAGKVVIDGSSTVFPLSAAIAKQVEEKTGKNVMVEVGRSGRAAGSRSLSLAKPTSAARRARLTPRKSMPQPREASNSSAKGCHRRDLRCRQPGKRLDRFDLRRGFEEDVGAEFHGQNVEGRESRMADKELQLYGADSDSGTFDFFTEVINGKSKQSRTEYTASGDDNVLVTGVRDNKYALGYIPFAYFEENKDSLKAVGSDSGSQEGLNSPWVRCRRSRW